MLNYPDYGALALDFLSNPDLVIPMWYYNTSWAIYMTDDVMVSLDTLSANPDYGLRKDGKVWGLHQPSEENRLISKCGKPLIPVSYVNSNSFDKDKMQRVSLGDDFQPTEGILDCSDCRWKDLGSLFDLLND